MLTILTPIVCTVRHRDLTRFFVRAQATQPSPSYFSTFTSSLFLFSHLGFNLFSVKSTAGGNDGRADVMLVVSSCSPSSALANLQHTARRRCPKPEVLIKPLDFTSTTTSFRKFWELDAVDSEFIGKWSGRLFKQVYTY